MTASRRDALKLFGTLPLLPTVGFALEGLPSFAQNTSLKTMPTLRTISYQGIAAPNLSDPEKMARVVDGARMIVSNPDGVQLTYQLAYQSFFTTGDQVPDGKGGMILAGGYFDIHNRPIMDNSVSGKERQFFSDCPDGSSLISLPHAKVKGVKGNTVFAVVQYEYTSKDLSGKSAYGILPSPMSILTLDQHPKTGELKLVKYHHVDTSAVHGLWITCGASLSPWQTHLSSEEYEPDAFVAKQTSGFKAFSRHLYGDESKANPYHYGHLPEIMVHPDGTGTAKKHFCCGRISHELVQVMPDERTLIMGDDATNAGLFLFIADKARDLSSGHLYVAQYGEGLALNTTSKANITWLHLGHATSSEIEKLADTLQPEDIMEVRYKDPNDESFTPIMISGKPNWVKVKPDMEKAAAFLETHRYAALMGGTMAFTKLEGTTLNAKDKWAYSALQNIMSSMVKGDKAQMRHSPIAMEKALMSGGILKHKLGGDVKDHQGNTMQSEWVPLYSQFLLLGEDIPTDELGNRSHPDKVASPDNIKFNEKLRTLFIGEDSGGHVNNFLWAYQVDTGVCTRLLSTPCGAESTGLHAVDEVNGFTYILSHFQHPGDWENAHSKELQEKVGPLIKRNYKQGYAASVGYIAAKHMKLEVLQTTRAS